HVVVVRGVAADHAAERGDGRIATAARRLAREDAELERSRRRDHVHLGAACLGGLERAVQQALRDERVVPADDDSHARPARQCRGAEHAGAGTTQGPVAVRLDAQDTGGSAGLGVASSLRCWWCRRWPSLSRFVRRYSTLCSWGATSIGTSSVTVSPK